MLAADGRDWPRALLDTFERPLRPSAVLVPIVLRAAGPTVLLTERSAQLKHHASQIAFPGGGMEAGDADVTATALRETEEEVGIPPSAVDVAGWLSTLPTVTGYAVTPVVGFVDGAVRLSLDPREVADAFEVPLAFLLDPTNQRRERRRVRGVDVPVIAYDYGPRRIWGATAAMLVALQKKIVF